MKKQVSILVLFIMIMVAASMYTYAAIDCNLTVPTVVGNLSQINVSVNTTGTVTTSAAFFAYSSLTRNSSTATMLANVTNSSRTLAVNLTFGNNIILEDSNDYSVYAICYNNGTGTNGALESTTSATTTGITFDRTKPTPPTAITFTNPVKSGDTITATIDRANANRCYIQFGGTNTPLLAMTLSGSTCTYTVSSNNPPNSAYNTFFVANDRTNSTTSSLNYVTVQSTTSGGGTLSGTLTGDQAQIQQVQDASTSPSKNKATMLLIVLGIGLFLLFGNKK